MRKNTQKALQWSSKPGLKYQVRYHRPFININACIRYCWCLEILIKFWSIRFLKQMSTMGFKNDPRVYFRSCLTPHALNPTHHIILQDWNIPNKGKSRHRLSNKFLLTTTIYYFVFDAGEIFGCHFFLFHTVKCFTQGCFRPVDLATVILTCPHIIVMHFFLYDGMINHINSSWPYTVFLVPPNLVCLEYLHDLCAYA